MATLKVFVAPKFVPPGTTTTLPTFLAGLQQAFAAWSAVCNVKFVLVQSPWYALYLCPIACTIYKDANAFSTVANCRTGGGNIRISNAPNKAIRWDQVPTMSYDLMVHELGHTLGLGDWQKGDHPNSIMNWGTRPNTPGAEDIARVQKTWGKPGVVK